MEIIGATPTAVANLWGHMCGTLGARCPSSPCFFLGHVLFLMCTAAAAEPTQLSFLLIVLTGMLLSMSAAHMIM